MARVKILNEVPEYFHTGEWKLCFQYCEYIYENEESEREFGYRFIQRRPDGSLQAARGQARIPSITELKQLLQLADDAGWLGEVEKLNNDNE